MQQSDATPTIRQLLIDLQADLLFGLRQLRRAPGFSVLVIAIFAIGIGSTATMAGVVDRLMLREPPAIVGIDHLARLFTATPGNDASFSNALDYPTALAIAENTPEIESLAAFWRTRLSLNEREAVTNVGVTLVSPDFFKTFQVQAMLGRTFAMADGFPKIAQVGGPPVAVLSHNFWSHFFQGDSSVIGRSILVGNISYTIVGVTPPLFRGIEATVPDMWLPLSVTTEAEFPMITMDRRDPWLQIVVRMRPGTATAAMEAAASATYRNLNGNPLPNTPDTKIVATSLIRGRSPDAPKEVQITLWLTGVAVIVLLIICANVANLLIARALSRRREIAVRLALGANRARLARQLVAEGLLLSISGGLIGLVFAEVSAGFLQRYLESDLGTDTFIDTRLLLATFVISVFTGTCVSMMPLFQSTGLNLTTSLRTHGSVGDQSRRVRSVLLGVQTAFCVVLIAGAGLFVRSLQNIQGLDLGFNLDKTLNVFVNTGRLNLGFVESNQVMEDLRRQIAGMPGVKSVALAQSEAFRAGHGASISRRGETFNQTFPGHTVEAMQFVTAVGSDFFHAIGTSSLHGRDFEERDRAGSARVVILNGPLAHALFPAGDAIGKCVMFPKSSYSGPECVDVIGVVDGVYRTSLLRRQAFALWVPLAQSTDRFTTPSELYLTVDGDVATVKNRISQILKYAKPTLPGANVSTMREVISPELRPWNLGALMFGFFGICGLIVALLGLYGVVAFSVTQRYAEIALRMALGATQGRVLLVVVKDALFAIGCGIVAGTAVMFGGRSWFEPLLFRTSVADPALLSAIACLMLLVSLFGMIVPSLRALRQNPANVMRGD